MSETLIELEPSATRSRPSWKSASGQLVGADPRRSGASPDSTIRIAAGQQCGPRWAPRMSSSLSSLMMRPVDGDVALRRRRTRRRSRACGAGSGPGAPRTGGRCPRCRRRRRSPSVRSRTTSNASCSAMLTAVSAPHGLGEVELGSIESRAITVAGALRLRAGDHAEADRPAAGDHDDSSNVMSARSTRVQRAGERLGERRVSGREVLRDLVDEGVGRDRPCSSPWRRAWPA